MAAHQFLCETSIGVAYFHVIKLKDSFVLWIGTEQGNLENLAVGMCLQDMNSSHCTTKLLGSYDDTLCENLASKVTKKTGKQVFVSCSLPLSDPDDLRKIELRLFEELKSCPEKFF